MTSTVYLIIIIINQLWIKIGVVLVITNFFAKADTIIQQLRIKTGHSQDRKTQLMRPTSSPDQDSAGNGSHVDQYYHSIISIILLPQHVAR